MLEILAQLLDQASAIRAALDRFALAASSGAQTGLAPYGPDTLLTLRELDRYLGIAHGRGRAWATPLGIVRATPAGERVRLGDVVAALDPTVAAPPAAVALDVPATRTRPNVLDELLGGPGRPGGRQTRSGSTPLGPTASRQGSR